MTTFTKLIDPAALAQALEKDTLKKKSADLSDQEWCALHSYLSYWEGDTFLIKVMASSPSTNYASALASYRLSNGYGTVDNSYCHNKANVTTVNGNKVVIPFKYIRFTDGQGTSLHSWWTNGRPTLPKEKVTGGLKFQTMVDFYEWMISDKNPVMKLMNEVTKNFTVLRWPTGVPIGVSYVIDHKNEEHSKKIGMFNAMSRFLYDSYNHGQQQRRCAHLQFFYEELKYPMKIAVLFSDMAHADRKGWYADGPGHDASLFAGGLYNITKRWLDADARNHNSWSYFYSGETMVVPATPMDTKPFVEEWVKKGLL